MSLGIFLTIIGAGINGSFAAPMKRMRGWEWEHSWFSWALSGLLFVPWVTALLTIPGLFDIYAATSTGSIGLVLVFGFLWGASAVLFGLGIDRLGLAIGFGIILGISSALGAIGPLIAQHQDQLLTRVGIQTMGGVFLLVLGVAGCAVAGRIRELATGDNRKGSLAAGLVICTASGIGTPMMNFGLSYGTEITDKARRMGVPDAYVVNALWPVLLAAGFLANASYCLFLMFRKSGVRPLIEANPGTNFPLGFLMGLMWMGGLLMYGYASRLLGPLGLVVGWPIMMGCTVLTANAWGVATGEWKGAPGSAKTWMAAGVILLIIGVSVVSAASRYQS